MTWADIVHKIAGANTANSFYAAFVANRAAVAAGLTLYVYVLLLTDHLVKQYTVTTPPVIIFRDGDTINFFLAGFDRKP